MLQELVTSCFLIVAAEMGDKSQILAMTFATKYSIRQVMLGVSIGALLNHGIAVALGSSLPKLISLDLVRIFAGIAFIAFALFSLAHTEDDDLEDTETNRFGPVITVATTFFIGELGDKTQLAAITLSSSAEHPLLVLAGTVSGMIITSAIGIIIGSRMGRRIPEFAMRIVSVFVFLFFGLISLYNNLPQELLTPTNIFLAIMILGLTVFLLTLRAWEIHSSQGLTPMQTKAEKLRQQLVGIKALVDDMCLNPASCASCGCSQCVLERAKQNISAYLNHKDVIPFSQHLEKLKVDPRYYDVAKAREAYCQTVAACQHCNPVHKDTCILNETRKALEKICFNKVLPFTGDMETYLQEVKKESPVLAAKIKRMITAN
ncbi:MAG: TMEM165/GDT1 family protein [Candidatus Wallacebacter cryptica]|nr:TMEM165/GDT1 family protein [Bacillota bacterium]